MTQPNDTIGDLTLGTNLDLSGVMRDIDKARQFVERTNGIRLDVDTKPAQSSLETVQKDLAALQNLSKQDAQARTQAARVLGTQYQAQAQAIRVVTAETQKEAAEARKLHAQHLLSSRLASEARRIEQERSRANISALENEMRAYRNLWQARQLGNDEVIAAQRRIHEQALLQAAAVDKQSDAYRRLTQVAAGAQRTVDQAQGINTPGGFASGVTQGIVQALGNLGPFGQLLEQIINAGMHAAQEAAREGAQGVGRQAGAGLSAGLAGQREEVRRAAVNLAGEVQEGAEDRLDIRSPSRVMRRVGEFAGEGLADGLTSKRDDVARAAKGLAQAAEQNATPHLNPVSGGGLGGMAVIPSAQAGLGKVAVQAALATAALGGTALAVGAVATGMVNGTRKAAEYQQGLAEMSLLTDKLPEQMGEVGRSILKMTTEVNRSFGELKAGYEEILGASVQGTEDDAAVLDFLRTSANLAKVARTETRVAADALTSLLNAYGMDASQATRVSEMLWASIKAGKVSLAEAAGGLGAVAGQAKSLNVPLDELLSAMALLTALGIPASTALEYIRSALSNVQKPSSQARDMAKSLGIEFNATALKSMGLVKFLDQLGRGVGDNSEALATLIGDVGGLQAVLGLLNGGLEDTGGILGQVRDSTGALDRDVVKLKGTAVENAKAFSAAWERAQISFNSGVLPMFTSALNWGTDFLNKLVDINAELGKMGEGKAAYGATEYSLPAWLARTGLREQDLTPDELRRVKELLAQTQAQANRGAQNSAIWNNAHLPGVAGFNDRNTAQAIGRLGVQLGAIQAAASQRTGGRVEGPSLNSTPNPLPVQIVAGKDLVTLLGMGGRTVLNPFGVTGDDYHHDGAVPHNAVHNGVDYGAPRGAPILAPFSGTLSVRENKTSGKIFELIDAAGNKLVGIHLDQFNAEVLKALKAGGGRALIAQGTKIGTVGNSGTTAGSYPHLHLMGYAAGSKKPSDPTGIQFQGVQGGDPFYSAAYGRKETAGPASRPPAKAFADYEKEARRILDQIKKYAPGGSKPDGAAWARASAMLQAFTKDNDLAQAAVSWVQAGMKDSAKTVSQYGQQFDRLKTQLDITGSLDNLGRPAAELTGRLEGIRKEALAGAQAEKTRWGETAKYKALLDLAGDSAKRLDTIRSRKPEQTELQRDQAVQRERVAMEALEKSIRKAGRDRLESIVQGGVTAQTSLAKWEAARKELERRDELARNPKPSDLQREQAAQRERVAMEALEKSIRGASRARLEAISKGGVTPEVSLAKWEAARKELERRDQPRRDRDLTPLQREQGALKEAQAQERLEKAIRGASRARLQDILAAGVQKEGDLVRWKAADAELKRRDELARNPRLSNLQREQATVREAQAQERLEKAIRGASTARLKDILAAGVQKEGDLARWKAADAELKRRDELARNPRLSRFQQEQQAQRERLAQQRLEKSLHSATDERLSQIVAGGVTPETTLAKWEAAQREIDRRKGVRDREDAVADRRREEAARNRLVAERALQDGNLDLARSSAQAVIKNYDLEVTAAGESASARLEVEERLGADVLAARNALSRATAEGEKLRLQRERNAAVNAEGLTLAQRQALWAQYAARIAQVDTDLTTTLAGNAQAADAALSGLQDRAFSEEEAGKAQAYADRVRGILDGIQSYSHEGLITLYDEARATRDQQLLTAVYDEWERRRLEQERQQGVISQMQSDANTALAEGAKRTADELAQAGDSDGALAVLEGALSDVMDAAMRGEDAADAISQLVDAINGLAEGTALADEFNAFVAGLSGTVSDQIDQVMTRLEEVTNPAMRARLRGLLADLRADLPKYPDPYAAGYLPGPNGFVNQGGDGSTATLDEIATARDLTTSLAGPTDPDAPGQTAAEVQGLMAEASTLLASEVGQRLPPSIRQALEEGVTGAQAYLDALAGITEEGITDGWERATKNVPPLPGNDFTFYADEIYRQGRAGLADPAQKNLLVESLQQARAESRLTEADLQNLLALIEEFTTDPKVEIGKKFDFPKWQQDLQDLTDGFDSGEKSAEEYAQGLGIAASELYELAAAAEAAGNIPLAQRFRELAVSLRALNPEIAATLRTLGKVQEYAGYVQELAGAFGALADAAGGSDLAANLNGLGNLAGKVTALAGDVMRIVANPLDIGAWVGGISKLIGGIAEAIGGFKKARAEAKRMQEDFNKQFTLIRGDDYAKTFVRSRGFFADLFGGGPEVKQEVNEVGLAIAKGVEGGMVGGLKSGLKAWLMSGDMSQFSKTFRQGAFEGVVDGIIEAVFDKALMEIVGPGIKALTDSIQTEDTSDDAAGLAAFEDSLVRGERFATEYGQRVQPGLDRLRADLGITSPQDGSGVSGTQGLSTLPEPIQFALATPLLEGVRGIKDAADVLKEGAVLIRDTFKDGIRVTVNGQSAGYQSTTAPLL